MTALRRTISATTDKIRRVLRYGKDAKASRTEEGSRRVFVDMRTYDLRKGIPVLTAKKTNTNSILKELTWFMRGEQNIKTLGCKIWDKWAAQDGDCGKIYGAQWCRWEDTRLVPAAEAGKYRELGFTTIPMANPESVVVTRTIDQLTDLVEGLKERPLSRRHIVTAWNPAYLPDESVSPQMNVANGQASLASCHSFFQCFVEDGYLDMFVYQRSADLFLGYPFNETSYGSLQTIIGDHVDLEPRFMHYCTGDTHLYDGQLPLAEELLRREDADLAPDDHNIRLKIINRRKSIRDYQASDLVIENYRHLDAIRIEPQV